MRICFSYSRNRSCSLCIFILIFAVCTACLCRAKQDSTPLQGCLEGNCTNGVGKYATTTGIYTGSFKNGLPYGEGIYEFYNGDRYEGYNENFKKEKYGTYFYGAGGKYVGEWKNDVREGQGIYYYANGDKYVGEWRGNVKKGSGVYYYHNGDRYEGNFDDDKPHGAGCYIYRDGRVKKGYWVYGTFAGTK